MDNLNLEQNFAPIIIDKDVQCTALSKSDFIRLNNYLNEFNADIKNLAELDGFLVIIAINHKSYYEEFICSLIYNTDYDKDGAKKIFKTKEQYDDFVDLFSRRIMFLFEAISQEKLENMLLFDINEMTDVSIKWMRGITRGLIVFDEDIGGFDKENYADTINFLSLIAYQDELETPEEKEIIKSIYAKENIIDVALSYIYFLNDEITTKLSQSPNTVKNVPKPKRNDLCDCGSGKKYKKCCGNNTY